MFRRFVLGAFFLLAPLTARAGTPDMIFVDDLTLSQVYHVGLPCPDRNSQSYLLAVMPRVAALATNPAHLKHVLKKAVYDMKYWKTGNWCAGAERVPVRAVVIFHDAKVAEARFTTDGFFIDDFTFELAGEAPQDDAYGAMLTAAMTQGGALYGSQGWPRDDFDHRAAAAALAEGLATVAPDRAGDLRFLIGDQLYLDYDTRLRNEKDKPGFDWKSFDAGFRDASGAHVYLATLEEAARLGSPGAVKETFELSGLKHAVHDVVYNEPDSGIKKMSPEKVDRILRNYGFLIPYGEALNVGDVLSYVAGAEYEGYSITENAIFRDMTLPPGRPAIEQAMNSELGASALEKDHVLSVLTGLPDGAVVSCDGTWCTALGGFGGRYRFLVRGDPECSAVADGRAHCKFRMRMVFSMGEVLDTAPYQPDPVVDFLKGVLHAATGAIDDWELEGDFTAKETTWTLDGEVAVLAGPEGPPPIK